PNRFRLGKRGIPSLFLEQVSLDSSLDKECCYPYAFRAHYMSYNLGKVLMGEMCVKKRQTSNT
ncbi:MAG: hypothetical protein ACTTJ7_05905, partial [Treponema sp.]